ncbi:MAG: hypothetical protein IID46_06700, partial [Planctomycetes bacterium]|nr:hypothetical protein [Planctomycetota bacterium]
MKTHFGPWSIAINPGNNPQLSTFWKRRLMLLPSLSRVESRMDSRGMCLIGFWGLMLLILPLFRPQATAVAQLPEAKQDPGRIVFWRMHRLASVLPNGGDFQWITQSKNERGVDNPRLSPNRKLLAYGVRKQSDDGIIHGDDPARIYIRNLEKTGQERDLGVEGHLFSWSPKSDKLAVTQFEKSGEEISTTHFIVDVKPGNTDTLNVPPNHIITDWSPDGKSFLTSMFVNPDPNQPGDKGKGIVSIVRRDGSKVRHVSSPGQMAVFGRFSPNGKMVLYLVKDPKDLESTKSSIWVTSLSDGKSRK